MQAKKIVNTGLLPMLKRRAKDDKSLRFYLRQVALYRDNMMDIADADILQYVTECGGSMFALFLGDTVYAHTDHNNANLGDFTASHGEFKKTVVHLIDFDIAMEVPPNFWVFMRPKLCTHAVYLVPNDGDEDKNPMDLRCAFSVFYLARTWMRVCTEAFGDVNLT